MTRLLLLAPLALLCSACKPKQETTGELSAGGIPRKMSLIVAEVMDGRKVADRQTLVRYDFENGQLISRERIAPEASEEINYGHGSNQIHLNQYAITRWGDIVDTHTAKLLFRGNGELVACEGNEAVIRRTRDEDKGYYIYDLSTQTHRKLEPGNPWELSNPTDFREALLSPDKTKSIRGNNQVILHTLTNQPETLADGLKYYRTTINSFEPLPMIWLDDNTILTQRENGELITVDLDKNINFLLEIPLPDELKQGSDLVELPDGSKAFPVNPTSVSVGLYRDPIDRLIYYCNDHYLINVEKKSFTKLKWHKIGHGFESAANTELRDPDTLRYQGQNIGFGRLQTITTKTAPGHIAATYMPTDMHQLKPAGIKVWSAHNRNWTIIEVDWFAQIIGWIEDE